MRTRVLLSLVLLGCLCGPLSAAHAALKKYGVLTAACVNSDAVSPNPTCAQRTVPPGTYLGAVAVVHDSSGAPVLRKLLEVSHDTVSVLVPGLSASFFRSVSSRQGPGGTGFFHEQPNAAFTGTGSQAAGSSVRWGIVTGWTISGSAWCNSNPGVICTLGMFADEATTDPRFNSEFYDLGSWTFHGTGFTSVPYIDSYNTSDPGNVVKRYRGGPPPHGSTVPVLSWLGVALLGGSLAAGGYAALRQRR